MTTRRQMAEMAAMQMRVITALRDSGDARLMDRLVRCTEARLGRRSGDGRPWTCRSAGCSWCRITQGRRWWVGIQHWITAEGGPVSLAILPLAHRPGELRAAVVRQRRAVRDVRDRAVRRRGCWRGVALAGIASGNGTTLLLIRHSAISRAEVAEVINRRWPDAIIREGISASPGWALSVEDAVELAQVTRGVEPLRIVVLPQRTWEVSKFPQFVGQESRMPIEPMPIAF
jgi:hypothetical protein